jgi:hypothetical protein
MVDDGYIILLILILLFKGASVFWSFSSRKINYKGNGNALHE